MKNIILLIIAAILLFAAPVLLRQNAFAGQIGCQTGPAITPTPREIGLTKRQLAAAQVRNEKNQPPTGGLAGSDTAVRSNVSFFSSVLVLLGGLWALMALLRQRFGKSRNRKSSRLPAYAEFVFKPGFALPVFGFLFVAAIIGSTLTLSPAVKAEKRPKPVKRLMTGPQNPSNKPVFKTAQQIGGNGITQIGAPFFDSAGNRYVRGGFTGTLTIGGVTLTATRDFDMFVAKYDPNGNPLWARQASGVSAAGAVPSSLAIEGATALGVDAGGNVYLGGAFVKSITLQGGGSNPSITLTDNGTAGVNYESFIAKYDQNGNLLWARGGNTNSPKNAGNLEIGQNGVDQIVFDQTGNPYIAGFVAGSNFLGTSFVNKGMTDILLAKINPASGAVVWQKTIGGTNDDNGLDLKIDGTGNLYLIGNFGSASITFPTAPATTFDNTDDSTATFIAKFAADGTNIWAKELDNTSDVGSSQIAVNPAGEIFLTGYFFDSVTFGATTLTENEGSGDESESSLGGYITKLNANGDYLWAKSFGGTGEALALDGAGRVYITGTFWEGGTFGAGTSNEETLASFGGEDLYVARYDSNGDFDFAKAIASTGQEGQVAIGNPSDPNNLTENNYNPLGIAYNPARDSLFVAGDFQGTVALDCITLTTPGSSRQSYIAELSRDNEPVSCRIWNGLDEDDNNWDSIDNWNSGIVPGPNESVYVPYTGNNFDAPDFNPSTNTPLAGLSLADDRILTLGENLTVNNRLDLLGGFIDAGDFIVYLGGAAQSLSISEGRVIGRVEKQFGSGNPFTFPVGTLNGYSPVTLSNITGTGSFSVKANEGTYPNQANNLPANRAARWWNLTNGGLTKADLTFQYVEGDITGGIENNYRAYRIPTGGGTATPVPGAVNTITKTVTAPNVNEFSDWTLAETSTADLSITVTDAPDPVSPGNNIVYTINAANGGPNEAVNAVVTDTLPAGTTFQSLSAPGGWACSTPPVSGTGSVSCSGGTIAVNANGTFILIVNVNQGTAGGTITNTAMISSSAVDPNPANNSASASTTVAEFSSPAPTGLAPKALLVKPGSGNTTAGGGASDPACTVPAGVTVGGTFANINQALGAASSNGDTIYVCPKYNAEGGGVAPYIEQVSLGFTNLSVIGIRDSKGSRVVIAANPSTSASATTQPGTNYIVQIQATGVNFGNFVVDGAPNNSNFTGTGVFNGVVVRRPGAFVFNNTIQNIRTGDFEANSNGQAIAVIGAGTTANPVNVLNNVVQNYRSNGVNVSAGSSASYAFVRGNYITGSSNDSFVPVPVLRDESGSVSDKTAIGQEESSVDVNLAAPGTNAAQIGIHFEAGAGGDIFNNRLTSFRFSESPCIFLPPLVRQTEQADAVPCFPFPALGESTPAAEAEAVPAVFAAAIRLDVTSSTSASPLRVRYNLISRSQMGIFGQDVQNVSILNNTITGSELDGIHLQGSAINLGANFNTISGNSIFSTRRAGIFLGLAGGDASLGNAVNTNTIDDAYFGVEDFTPAGNNTITNTGAAANAFINVNIFRGNDGNGNTGNRQP